MQFAKQNRHRSFDIINTRTPVLQITCVTILELINVRQFRANLITSVEFQGEGGQRAELRAQRMEGLDWKFQLWRRQILQIPALVITCLVCLSGEMGYFYTQSWGAMSFMMHLPACVHHATSCVVNFAVKTAPHYTKVKLLLGSKVLCALFFNLHSLPFLLLSPLWWKFQNKTRTEPLTQGFCSPLYLNIAESCQSERYWKSF